MKVTLSPHNIKDPKSVNDPTGCSAFLIKDIGFNSYSDHDTWGVSCPCSNVWNDKRFILHPCVPVNHASILPHSPQQDNLSRSAVCCPSLFGLLLKWQDHYHKGQLLPLGNICMSTSPSASFSVSICHSFIVFYPCFLLPRLCYPTHPVTHSLVENSWSVVRNIRGHLFR